MRLMHQRPAGGSSGAYSGSVGMPRILVDGPYGSASEEVFQYRTLILVGAGIGVTPFVSIMRSLVLQHKYKQALVQEERRNRRSNTQGGYDDGAAGRSVGDDLQVHFFWCCRNRQEFNSFKGLLKDDIRSNSSLAEKFVFNLYMSGEVEVTSGDVQKELDEYAKWTKLFTGRPNWNRIFKGIRNTAKPGEHVGVFMCGPAAIASQLKSASRKHSDKRSAGFSHMVKRTQGKAVKATDPESGVYFDFHKENF